MSRHRIIIRLSVVLAVVALAKGCTDGNSPTAPPTPEPARPTTVTVSPATPELTALGATVQLRAEVRDQNAIVMAGVTVTWTTSASSVATVDAAGLATAAGNGTTTITASAGSASGFAVVTVAEVATLTLRPGDAVQLPYAFPHWMTDNPAVVQVDDDGLVIGLSAGLAVLTTDDEDPSHADYLIEGQIYGETPIFMTTAQHVEITVASPMGGYPIQVNYLGFVPEVLRWGVETAAAVWSDILAPTEAASFMFDSDWEGYGGLWSGMGMFDSGETLSRGLHLYVVDSSERKSWGWAGPAGARAHGTSEVPMEPIGVVALNGELFREVENRLRGLDVPWAWVEPSFRRHLHEIALHEIAHVLGIGTSDRWVSQVEVPDPARPWHAWYTDPEAIATFDRMGGTDFPSKKIPLRVGHAHWDSCAGHRDLLGNHLGSVNLITELTMASLAEGYVYDPALAPERKLNRDTWNYESGRCRNGKFDPEFYGGPSQAMLRLTPLSPWAIATLDGDVIGGGGKGR